MTLLDAKSIRRKKKFKNITRPIGKLNLLNEPLIDTRMIGIIIIFRKEKKNVKQTHHTKESNQRTNVCHIIPNANLEKTKKKKKTNKCSNNWTQLLKISCTLSLSKI